MTWWWFVVAVIVAPVILYGVLSVVLPLHIPVDETRAVPTSDGHTLRLYRHKAAPGVPARAPVLCLHGLGASHYNLHYPGHGDLAGHLAAQGHDVWVASLRGDFDSLAPPSARPSSYSFDAYVERDLPAIVESIRAATGAARLHFVGHSMGGLLAYAYAGRHGDAAMLSVTAIGSPLGFEERGKVVNDDERLRTAVRLFPVTPIRLVARLAVPFLGLLRHTRAIRQQFNHANSDFRYTQRAMWNSLTPVPRGVMLQFEDWIAEDAFRSVDKAFDYREAVRHLKAPLMVVVGEGDFLARSSNALRAVERAASPLKRVLRLGRAYGHPHDYGHIDLILSPRAREDVFVPVAQFLVDAEAQRSLRGNGVPAG